MDLRHVTTSSLIIIYYVLSIGFQWIIKAVEQYIFALEMHYILCGICNRFCHSERWWKWVKCKLLMLSTQNKTLNGYFALCIFCYFVFSWYNMGCDNILNNSLNHNFLTWICFIVWRKSPLTHHHHHQVTWSENRKKQKSKQFYIYIFCLFVCFLRSCLPFTAC